MHIGQTSSTRVRRARLPANHADIGNHRDITYPSPVSTQPPQRRHNPTTPIPLVQHGRTISLSRSLPNPQASMVGSAPHPPGRPPPPAHRPLHSPPVLLVLHLPSPIPNPQASAASSQLPSACLVATAAKDLEVEATAVGSQRRRTQPGAKGG